MPEYVQLSDDETAADTQSLAQSKSAAEKEKEDDVASTREKFQQMQAQMDAAVAQAD